MITAFQAALIAFMCWFASLENGSPLGLRVHQLFYNPLVGGFIVGTILGHPIEGLMIGVAIQIMFISNVVVGGVATADMPFVAYPSIALAMMAGADQNVAITIAATVGIVGSVFFTLWTGGASVFYALGDRAIDKGDIGAMKRAYRLYPAIVSFILRAGATFAILMAGDAVAGQILASVPPIVLHIAGVLGGILPAVGISILLAYQLKDLKMVVFFMLGVLAVTQWNFNMISVAVLGACLAVMYYMFMTNKSAANEKEEL